MQKKDISERCINIPPSTEAEVDAMEGLKEQVLQACQRENLQIDKNRLQVCEEVQLEVPA